MEVEKEGEKKFQDEANTKYSSEVMEVEKVGEEELQDEANPKSSREVMEVEKEGEEELQDEANPKSSREVMEVEKEGEEELLSTERDWTAIPSELLGVIANKLPDFLDLIYFNATCKAWNPVQPSHAIPCHPWLFDSYNSLNSSFNFYSFTSSTTISIPSSKFNPYGARNVYSTSLGYFLSHLRGTTSFSLINPLVGNEYVLPPFEIIHAAPSFDPPRVLWAQDGFVLSIMSYASNYQLYLLNLYWHKNSERAPDWKFAFWFPADSHAVFELYNGEYFIYDDLEKATTVLDADTGDFSRRMEEPLLDNISSPSNDEKLSQRRIYLVKSSGELLKILMIVYKRKENPMLCRYLFFLYRLRIEGEVYCWVEMGGIGDQAIFLNQFDGFSLRSNEYPILRKNSIYFMKPMTNGCATADNLLNNHHTVIVGSRYDLETGLVDDFPHIMKGWGSWFLPKLH